MNLPAAYARFREDFRKVLDPRFHPIEWLDRVMAEGRAGLLAGEKSAILFELRDYPGGARVVHGLVAAGDLREIREKLIPRAEQWGRAVGCTHAIVESRDGWRRALKAQGYAPHQTAIIKEL